MGLDEGWHGYLWPPWSRPECTCPRNVADLHSWADWRLVISTTGGHKSLDPKRSREYPAPEGDTIGIPRPIRARFPSRAAPQPSRHPFLHAGSPIAVGARMSYLRPYRATLRLVLAR